MSHCAAQTPCWRFLFSSRPHDISVFDALLIPCRSLVSSFVLIIEKTKTRMLYKSLIEPILCFSCSVDLTAKKCSDMIDQASEIIRAKKVICSWHTCVTDRLCIKLTIFCTMTNYPSNTVPIFPSHSHPPTPDEVHGYKHIESSGIN